MIKAVIFDVGEVIVDTRGFGEVLMREFKLNGPELAHLMRAANIGKISNKKFFRALGKKLNYGEAESKRVFAHAYSSIHRSVPGTLNVVKALKKSGYRLAIVSNVIKPIVDLERGKKDEHWLLFNPLIRSYEVKLEKPDKRIFLLALKRLKLKPQECVFIDNLEQHIESAQKLGIKAILFKNAKQLKKDLRKLGVKA